MLSQGRSKALFRVEVAKKAIGVACIIVGSFFGIMGLAWSQVVVSVLALGVNAWPMRQSFGYGPLHQIWDLRGVAGCAIAMGGVTAFLAGALTMSPLLELAVIVPCSALIYGLLGFGLGLRSFREAFDILVQSYRNKH